MKKFAFAAAVLLCLTPGAWAGAYVGASVGTSSAEISSGPVSVDGDDTSWKIVGGYTFMKFVGVEASYRNFGGLDEAIGTTTFDTEATSIDVFGVATLPLGKVDVFAKLGYSMIDLEATIDDTLVPNPVTVTDDSEEVAYGAGISFGLGKAHLRLEYEAFETSDTLNMISAGAIFKF